MIFGHIYARKNSENPQKSQNHPKLPFRGLRTHWCGCTMAKTTETMKKVLWGGIDHGS